MTVDMVLAITHSKMRREHSEMPSIKTYEKGDEREMREKFVNSLENSKCIDMDMNMDMFRNW
jgi:hypothetical protein